MLKPSQTHAMHFWPNRLVLHVETAGQIYARDLTNLVGSLTTSFEEFSKFFGGDDVASYTLSVLDMRVSSIWLEFAPVLNLLAHAHAAYGAAIAIRDGAEILAGFGTHLSHVIDAAERASHFIPKRVRLSAAQPETVAASIISDAADLVAEGRAKQITISITVQGDGNMVVIDKAIAEIFRRER